MGASNISDLFMPERYKNESSKRKSSDKIRLLFTINTEEEAIKIYDYFTRRSELQRRGQGKLNPKDQAWKDSDDLKVQEQLMIYLQKDEEVFVKYGDEEAALYEAAEE